MGHDNEGVRFHAGIKKRRSYVPKRLDHPSRIIQRHFSINHIRKQALPILRHDGDEMRHRLGVIVSLQADGAAVS